MIIKRCVATLGLAAMLLAATTSATGVEEVATKTSATGVEEVASDVPRIERRSEPPLMPSGSSLGSPAQSEPGSLAPAAVSKEYSPAGCKGYTDYPHSSNGYIKTDNGPYASVHGRTKCNAQVPRVTARAEVWRKAWHGNTRLFIGNEASQTKSKTSGNSTPHYNCVGDGTQWYVGITNHTSLEGGKLYTQRTVEYGTKEKSEFNCTGF